MRRDEDADRAPAASAVSEPPATASEATELSLQEAVSQTMEEARVVLPGIQALFGFQLIAVFNQRFDTALSMAEQGAHLGALLLVGASIALTMTPAAYHRQAEQSRVSRRLLRVSSRLVSAALVPLMLGMAIDIYLVARVITQQRGLSALLAAALLVLLAELWFAFPRRGRRLGGASSVRARSHVGL